MPSIFDGDLLKYPGKTTRNENFKRRSRFKRELPKQSDQQQGGAPKPKHKGAFGMDDLLMNSLNLAKDFNLHGDD